MDPQTCQSFACCNYAHNQVGDKLTWNICSNTSRETIHVIICHYLVNVKNDSLGSQQKGTTAGGKSSHGGNKKQKRDFEHEDRPAEEARTRTTRSNTTYYM